VAAAAPVPVALVPSDEPNVGIDNTDAHLSPQLMSQHPLIIHFQTTKSGVHYRYSMTPPASSSLSTIESQMNASFVTERLLIDLMLASTKDNNAQGVSHPRQRSVFWNSTHFAPIMYILTWFMVGAATLLQYPLQAALWIMSLSFRSLRIPVVSMAAHQLEERATRLLSLRREWTELHSPAWRSSNTAASHEKWIHMFNTTSAIVMDWALGLAMLWLWWNYMDSPGSGLFGYDIRITDRNSFATTMWGYEKLRGLILWLQAGRPAGIKLNLPTSDILASIFLFYIERWAGSFHTLCAFTGFCSSVC
jgi:hypothetical protein